jgi:hypothetical protein
MNSMERRLGRLERQRPVPPPARVDVICFGGPGEPPGFAFVWTGDGYENVSREDEESEETFLTRCDAMVRP